MRAVAISTHLSRRYGHKLDIYYYVLYIQFNGISAISDEIFERQLERYLDVNFELHWLGLQRDPAVTPVSVTWGKQILIIIYTHNRFRMVSKGQPMKRVFASRPI